VIRILAAKLEAGGDVRRGYSEVQYVNQSAMAIGTLASPVEFHEMRSPEKVIKTEIVFLLALKDQF